VNEADPFPVDVVVVESRAAHQARALLEVERDIRRKSQRARQVVARCQQERPAAALVTRIEPGLQRRRVHRLAIAHRAKVHRPVCPFRPHVLAS